MTHANGDKEIVLGNKQLITLFFVVVALLGVFFAMGYLIGRNTTKPEAPTPDTSSSATPNNASAPAQETEPPRETAAGSPLTAPASRVESAPPESGDAQGSQPAPTAAQPARQPELARRATEQAKTAHAVATVPLSKIEAGATYLQVTALGRPDADNLVRTLREQSFPALLAESSKSGLFRVLVGPYDETAKLADAKSRLRALGFANAFVQR